MGIRATGITKIGLKVGTFEDADLVTHPIYDGRATGLTYASFVDHQAGSVHTGFGAASLTPGGATETTPVGPIGEYAATERAGAIDQGLGLVVGLNVFTGGDGSSRIRGPGKYADDWAMSAGELDAYGSTLIAQTDACGFIMWRYSSQAYEDYGYWDVPEIDAAMRDLAAQAAAQPAAPCTR